MTARSLAAIHAAAFPEGAWTERTFADLLQQPEVLLTGDGSAFVLGRVIADEAEVLTLATHPAQQRKGLADRWLKDFIDRAMQAGANRVFLEVAADNDAARKLYAKYGFEQVGLRQGYYRRSNNLRVDALVLSRKLT